MTHTHYLIAFIALTLIFNVACLSPDSNEKCQTSTPDAAWTSGPLEGVLPDQLIQCTIDDAPSPDSGRIALVELSEGTTHRATMDAVGRIQGIKDTQGNYVWTRTDDSWHNQGSIDRYSRSVFKNARGDTLEVSAHWVHPGGLVKELFVRDFTRTRYNFTPARPH